MSVFNDIGWKKNDDNCISNAEKVKNYTKRFLPGHWTFLGPGSEKKWYGSSYDGQLGPYSHQNGTAIQRNWSSYFHSHQYFESRNVETKARQMYHSLQWRFFMNIDVLFQTIHSVNQVRIYAVVTNWCYKFALKKENKNTFLHQWTIELRLLWKPKNWTC